MTHEEFLAQLLRANQCGTSPSRSGLTEAEAVARWMAWLTMCHLRIEHTPSGQQAAVPTVTQCWTRWAMQGAEDVDFSVRVGSATVRLKALVNSGGTGLYLFRLHDYASSLWFDAQGRAVRERGRIDIQLTRFPQTWAMLANRPAARAVDTLRFQPAPCCRRALANIRRVTDSLSAARTVLAASQWVGLLETVVLPPGEASVGALVEGANATYQLADSDIEHWARAMAALPVIERGRIRDIATLEALNHATEESKYRFWSFVADSGRIP